ncbi:hypothetical protein E6C70_10270 [Glaciibacter flavus]|uniref:Uncharacterized protein n=1 Tax=Orlajensenia flava TaxID=2565934 RepID=A0A4V3WTY5_9MICO|nr:hypothetical protein [Glaciibacter flavus]THG33827.1 hypothetical protein E6C70_10270 [Glaciibacter flavus]
MKNYEIVLHGRREDAEKVEQKQRRSPPPTSVFLERPIMVALLVLLSVIAVGSIAGTISLVARDGYGRAPKRSFVRTI